MSPSSKKPINKSDWERKLNQIPVSKDDLNKLVMDYLLIEGYKSAAQSFANEASLTPAIDLESIENRMVIRGAVQRGDIETAVGWVNELDPERLIELIRSNDILGALNFASEELAPRGEEFPELLPELEQTMALLAFDLSSNSSLKPPSHIQKLLSSEQRFKTAGELNAAILKAQNQNKEPKLPKLLELLRVGEGLLKDGGNFNDGEEKKKNEGVQFPRLSLNRELVNEGERMRGNVEGEEERRDSEDVAMNV